MKKNIPYPLSRDYKRLRELLDKGYSIVCYADYSSVGNTPLNSICEGYKHTNSEGDRYALSIRGRTYLEYAPSLHSSWYTFEQHCESRNIEFIDIEIK